MRWLGFISITEADRFDRGELSKEDVLAIVKRNQVERPEMHRLAGAHGRK